MVNKFLLFFLTYLLFQAAVGVCLSQIYLYFYHEKDVMLLNSYIIL